MKCAVIGLGNISHNHINSIKDLGHQLIAVCDIDDNKTGFFKGKNAYTEYRKMLDDESLDVVHICTPHYLHAEMIIECLKRNINVICEKPLCISYDEMNDILDIEKNSTAILGVCQQNRYNPNNLFVKNYLKDKKILNAFATVVWARDDNYYSSGEWRGKWNTEGGGVLINQALHTLDIVQWLVGLPKSVIGITNNLTHKGSIEVEDTSCLLFKGDVPFTIFATNSSENDMPVEISIQTDSEFIQIINDYVLIDGEKITFDISDPVYGKQCYGSGHKRLISDFYEKVETNSGFQLNGQETSKVIRMILASYKSNGNPVII